MSADDPPWSRIACSYHERFVRPFVLPAGGPDEPRLELAQSACVSGEHAREARQGSDGAATGSTVWDAGIVLAAHLRQRGGAVLFETGSRPAREGRRALLELGAGTGIVGLGAAASGGFSHVVMSDLPSVLPLIRQNVGTNIAALRSEVAVEPLRWHVAGVASSLLAAHGPFDLIVGGDVLYRPQAGSVTQEAEPFPQGHPGSPTVFPQGHPSRAHPHHDILRSCSGMPGCSQYPFKH